MAELVSWFEASCTIEPQDGLHVRVIDAHDGDRLSLDVWSEQDFVGVGLSWADVKRLAEYLNEALATHGEREGLDG